MDLDSVIDELYGIDPSEFTSRRDQLSSEARREGDRELATAIKSLRRPSAAAYTVNLMARTRAEEVSRLIDLGARMREAQAALSGEELRVLGRQRSQLVAGLAQEARRITRQAGHPISEATEREVQATFEAALADAAAGEAVRAGRLMRAFEREGMEPVDLDGAVAGASPTAKGPTRAARVRPPEAPEARTEGGDEDERRRAAERDRDRAARALEEAERAEERARRAEQRRIQAADEHDALKGRRVEAEETVHDLEEQLTQARRHLDEAAEAERRARRVLVEAEEEADRAASGARRARAEADAFGR